MVTGYIAPQKTYLHLWLKHKPYLSSRGQAPDLNLWGKLQTRRICSQPDLGRS